MREPQLMPWLAHRSGLSRGRTESLWRDACRYAQNATGEHETPRYWKVATERMASLLEVESLANLPVARSPLGAAVVRFQAGLLAATAMLAQMSANARPLLARLPGRPA